MICDYENEVLEEQKRTLYLKAFSNKRDIAVLHNRLRYLHQNRRHLRHQLDLIDHLVAGNTGVFPCCLQLESV